MQCSEHYVRGSHSHTQPRDKRMMIDGGRRTRAVRNPGEPTLRKVQGLGSPTPMGGTSRYGDACSVPIRTTATYPGRRCNARSNLIGARRACGLYSWPVEAISRALFSSGGTRSARPARRPPFWRIALSTGAYAPMRPSWPHGKRTLMHLENFPSA